MPDTELTALLRALTVSAFPGAGAGLATFLVPGWSEQIIGELVDLGLVTLDPDSEPCPDCTEQHATVTLTRVGTPAVVALIRSVGIDVTERPDPATAGVHEMADLIEHLDTDAWSADVEAWLAARPDAGAAARQLVAAVATPDRGTLFVMAGLETLGVLARDAVVDAARELLGGRHDGITLSWLVGQGLLDLSTVDPRRLLIGSIDLLACALDTGQPEAVVDGVDQLAPGEQGALLRDLWRLDHPRVAELLDVLGTHHPSKPVAKEARRSAMKLRSRTR